ncbi:unnamed protein product [Fusarium venenatum]|uniref:BTB domain-containing protein n=1 Tax=Fusarium venenatum TaxID=56646 RepID=A0A2L2TP12_9HYPO|nr:uncharacterized protein FVRRES_06826 [Fusarium venenatum]CEI62390.1 unnamed protein product [Fusarium venenatum]
MEPFHIASSYDEHDESLSKLLDTGAYSDLTITCGTDTHAVHKAIVCTRSPFFAAACDGESKKAKTGIIDLPDDDPVAVKMVIRYFYLKNYVPQEAPVAPNPTKRSIQQKKKQCGQDNSPFGGTPSPGFSSGSSALVFGVSPQSAPTQSGGQGSGSIRSRTSPPPPSNLVLHAKVYALGEKYDIKGLKALALSKFKHEAAHHHHSESFILAAKHVYTSTIKQDWGMRNAVTITIQLNVDLLENKQLQYVIKNTDLGWRLLMGLTGTKRAELKRGAPSW